MWKSALTYTKFTLDQAENARMQEKLMKKRRYFELNGLKVEPRFAEEPLYTVNLLKHTLTKHGKRFDIKVYPGAPHAFLNDTRESYRPEAAKDAWERTLSFLNNTLNEYNKTKSASESNGINPKPLPKWQLP